MRCSSSNLDVACEPQRKLVLILHLYVSLYSDFILYCCLLAFSVLLSLRVDQVITWNYGVIFLPIWIWNATALVGTVVGVAYFIKKKSLRSVLNKVYLLMYTVSSLHIQAG